MNNKRPMGSLLKPGTIANNMKSTLASLNLANEAEKFPPVTAAQRILKRRSKSFSDFNRPSNIPPHRQLTTFNNPPSSLLSRRPPPLKPIPSIALPKRKADPPKENIAPKAMKVQPLRTNNKPPITKSTSAPVKSTAVKKHPAPYDYKARFQLLLEKHTTLKTDFSTLTEKSEELEKELVTYRDIQVKLSTKTEECREKSVRISKMEDEGKQLKIDFERITEENIKLQSMFEKTSLSLKEEEERNKKLAIEVKELKAAVDNLEIKNLELSKIIEDEDKTIEMLKQQNEEYDLMRRVLHNTIQDLKGNIRVFCRVRPILSDEYGRHRLEIRYPDECSLEISNGAPSVGNRRCQKQEFSFNRVFNEESSQAEVFQELGQLVQSVLDGYNVCVFAYGQTGSGKTFTMEGGIDSETMGMIPRTVDLLFDTIEKRRSLHWEYEITASFLEIYNEQIYDLLSNENLSHEIRMTDPSGVDVYVTNIQREVIYNSGELKELLYLAQRNRAVATTIMNERSSRSHAITKIEIVSRNTSTNEQYSASLNLVDLAGSEKARDSEVVRLTETKNINKSLSNLSSVILALMQKREHIPYRDSKLTHLLMPSLGGNSKTLMFVNISPLTESFNETVNSLRFAANVNSCKVGTIKRNY